MNPPAKLVAFLALLVAVFGMSYPPARSRRHCWRRCRFTTPEMVPPTGAVDGYALRAVEATQKPGKDVPVEFTLTAPGGTVLSGLDEDSGEHVHSDRVPP